MPNTAGKMPALPIAGCRHFKFYLKAVWIAAQNAPKNIERTRLFGQQTDCARDLHAPRGGGETRATMRFSS
jgi:hypothetical protein